MWVCPLFFFKYSLCMFNILLIAIFCIIMSRVPIKVSRYVMGRLRGLAVCPSESYESILSRLLDCKLGGGQLDYLVFNDVCCVRLFVDWDVCSPRIRFYSDGVLVDDFPVDCCFEDGLWSDFRESVCGVPDLLGVLAVLECGECTRVGGLSIGCVG